MKCKSIRVAAAILAAILLFTGKVEAISAHNAITLDAQTGRVLYEKNPDTRGLIASTTKIMTALIVCEQCNVLDRMRIPKEAVGIEGSSMYLHEGEVLTVQELLYGLMLRSGNDAAVALAIYCGGTVEGFVELMNDKARLLGLANTHFENPNGLDSPGHYSTARDLAVLTAYAMKDPIFAKTVSTKSVTAGERVLQNHNKLLWRMEGADGVKTGFTKAAGRILVSSAVRQGRRLITVTMNAPDDWNDHIALMDTGFADFTVQELLQEGSCMGRLPVVSGRTDSVELLTESGFCYALRPEERVELVVRTPQFVYAPVAKGQTAGAVYICVDGSAVGKIPLLFADTVEAGEENKPSLFKRLFGGKAE